MLLDLTHYLCHHLICQMPFTLDVEDVGPLLSFGGPGINAGQTDAIFFKGSQ